MSRRKWQIAALTAGLFGVVTAGRLQALQGDSSQDAQPALRRILPTTANPQGYSLVDLATAWAAWGFGTPPSLNPLIAARCERSSIDPRIWFLPVSLGGEYTNTCYVPQGSFLVLTPGLYECSEAEGNGSTPAALAACVDAGFNLLSYVEVTVNGTTTTDLGRYVETTRFDTLPADNILGSTPTPTMTKGYFVVLGPMSAGTHSLRAYDQFAAFDFQAGTTYRIVVR